MAEAFAGGHRALTVDLHIGAAPKGAHPGRFGLGIFWVLLRALHESRRRQAERDLRRHHHLLNRFARPPMRERS